MAVEVGRVDRKEGGWGGEAMGREISMMECLGGHEITGFSNGHFIYPCNAGYSASKIYIL